MSGSELVSRLRVEEHTGENRCLPCTGVNSVLALLSAFLVAVGLRGSDPAIAVGGGAVVLLLSSVLIYLRGYLVPGTPWLTRTFLPDRVLRWFDGSHGPSADGSTASSEPEPTVSSGFDVETMLMGAGVLTECVDEDDLQLTTPFRTAWRDRMAELNDDWTPELNDDPDRTATIGAFLGTDPDGLSITETDRNVVVHENRRPLGKWESRTALIADLAADELLSARVDDWATLDVHRRSSVLQGLRVFLDRCPDCDGRVTVDERAVDSCCRAGTVVAVSCENCAVRIAEIEEMG